MKIVVAGATGFLGRALIDSLEGHDVVALVRHGEGIKGAKPVAWNGLQIGPWADEVDGADAVVNFAGVPATLRWTEDNKKAIRESRVQSTYLIGQAIEGAERPPRVWINASAVGYYGSRGAEMLDESSSPGTGFLAEVCVAWENALAQESLPDTRRVALRTGVVLGRDGALRPLARLTKLFLGGRQGDGHHWMPWIHIDDHTAMVRWLLEADVAGPVNACGPAPCINETFMKTLRGVCARPFGLPAPASLIELNGKLRGPDSAAVLASDRALPTVAKEAGFKWKHPSLEEALRSIMHPN